MGRRFAVFVLAAAVIAAGCSEADDASGYVTVGRDGGSVVLTSSAKGRADVKIQFTPTGTPAVRFSSSESLGQGVSELYMFGLVLAGAASVETVPAGSAKFQPDGSFLAVIPNQAQSPLPSIHWRFLADDGTLVAEGDGPSN